MKLNNTPVIIKKEITDRNSIIDRIGEKQGTHKMIAKCDNKHIRLQSGN